jgi:hypothetical protein
MYYTTVVADLSVRTFSSYMYRFCTLLCYNYLFIPDYHPRHGRANPPPPSTRVTVKCNLPMHPAVDIHPSISGSISPTLGKGNRLPKVKLLYI